MKSVRNIFKSKKQKQREKEEANRNTEIKKIMDNNKKQYARQRLAEAKHYLVTNKGKTQQQVDSMKESELLDTYDMHRNFDRDRPAIQAQRRMDKIMEENRKKAQELAKRAGVARNYIKKASGSSYVPSQWSPEEVLDHAKLVHRMRKLKNTTDSRDTEYLMGTMPSVPTHVPKVRGGKTRRKRKNTKKFKKHYMWNTKGKRYLAKTHKQHVRGAKLGHTHKKPKK